MDIGRHLVIVLTLMFIGRANPQGWQTAEYIDLGERQARESIQTCSGTGHYYVKPTAAPRSASDRAKLAPVASEFLALGTEEFCRERTASHAGGVRLRDANHVMNELRSNSCSR